jgi:hypothetical protein
LHQENPLSASLTWRPVPVDPKPTGTAKHPLLGLVLRAFDTDESSIRGAGGYVLNRSEDAATFLRGALAATDDADLRSELAGFLAELDIRGSLLIDVVR